MNYIADFNDSFERVVSKDFDHFFLTFYRQFEGLSPAIAAVFENSPPSRRHQMLEDSILLLIDYAVSNQVSHELRQLAQFHQKLGVPNSMFDDWLEALISTLVILDKDFDDGDEIAWRTMLAPGISLVKNGGIVSGT